MQAQTRLFDSLQPQKIMSLFRLGDASVTPPRLGLATEEIVSGFYSFLGFTRLTSEKVIAKAIAVGVEKRVFGYLGKKPSAPGADAKYPVTPEKVRFGATLAEDEIDLEAGFILLPQAIPAPAAAPTTGPSPATGPAPASGPEPAGTISGGGSPTGPAPAGPPTPSTAAAQTSVALSFSADRNQLFTAWQALANLADLAGKVSVTISAEAPGGFDRGKLNNGILEPLREADLIS